MIFLAIGFIAVSAVCWLLCKELRNTNIRVNKIDADHLILTQRVGALEGAEDSAEAYGSF